MFRLLLIVFFLGFFVVFAMSNTDLETVYLAGAGWKIPLGTSVLAVASVGLFLGIILGWLGEFTQRRRARKAENQLKSSEKEMEELENTIEKLNYQIRELERENFSSPASINHNID